MRYRPTARIFFFIWIFFSLVLGWCGSQEPQGTVFPGPPGPTIIDYGPNSVTWLSRIASLYYFAYFLVITPILARTEKFLPVPDSLYTPVLSHPAAMPAGAAAAAET
jgi:ubiquinol-cytochrome c reductase cytochrome b subunit